MSRQLHIVCLDNPWPADYGGAIDMFCKIETLYKAGIKIHLHYFSYNQRSDSDVLKNYCESIHVYERKMGSMGVSRRLPYIVASRINDELISNLNKNEHPVLLEGIHCTGIIPGINKNKKILVRLHNDEKEYYRQLADATGNLFKKIYFKRESRLLGKYQQSLPKEIAYASITEKDAATFRNYNLKNVFFLPAFIPYKEINSLEGIGNCCLYHGNLSVPENEKVALWLLKNVFSKIAVPFVIAGKNPSKKLANISFRNKQCRLIANPTENEINDLLRQAHINVLPSFSSAGIKIKLLHALFEGRHCIVNDTMVVGTGLEAACHIAGNAAAFASVVMQLLHQPFTTEEITLRKKLMENTFSNEKNVQQLIQYLW
ncbi:MAG: glycosyltransferase family 4 protein [Sphingobacteriales bacterium]|nr:glycosyltransferase family 4 protein [Sphingobacteriales bacterium]